MDNPGRISKDGEFQTVFYRYRIYCNFTIEIYPLKNQLLIQTNYWQESLLKTKDEEKVPKIPWKLSKDVGSIKVIQ